MKRAILILVVLCGGACGGDGQPFGGDGTGGEALSHGGAGGKAVAMGGTTGQATGGAGGRNTYCDDDPCAQASIDHGSNCVCHTMDGPARGYCQCDAVPTGTGGATGGATGAGGSGGGGEIFYPVCAQPITGSGSCSMVISPTKTLTAYKDGRICSQCAPFQPGAAECTLDSGKYLCVHGCAQCEFKCVAPGCIQ